MIGRHLFDFVDGWGGLPIVGDRVFVVTHRDADEWQARYPDAPYTFCTDGVEDAVRRATEHAGDGTVIVCAGEVGGQVVAAGLADELAIDLAPVFLGQRQEVPRLAAPTRSCSTTRTSWCRASACCTCATRCDDDGLSSETSAKRSGR